MRPIKFHTEGMDIVFDEPVHVRSGDEVRIEWNILFDDEKIPLSREVRSISLFRREEIHNPSETDVS